MTMAFGTTTMRTILGAGLLAAMLLAQASFATGNALPGCRDAERFADQPCVGRKDRPVTVEAFLARPSLSEWEAQLELGWGGSDGSTAAADVIAEVRIGRTSRDHADIDLPANRHDWYYELGRTYALGWRFRRAADQAYRDMCLKELEHETGLRGATARANVRLRYTALRMVGFGAWLVRPAPVDPEPGAEMVAANS